MLAQGWAPQGSCPHPSAQGWGPPHCCASQLSSQLGIFFMGQATLGAAPHTSVTLTCAALSGCKCVAFQNTCWVCMPLLLRVCWLSTHSIHNSITACQEPQLFCTFPNLLSGVFSSAPNAPVELQTVTTCPLLFSEMAAIHTADVAVLKLP